MNLPNPIPLDANVEDWALECPAHFTRSDLEEIQERMAEALPGKRVVVLAAGMHLVPIASLDAAWAEAEAALPKTWAPLDVAIGPTITPGVWRAALNDYPERTEEMDWVCVGPTPAAALRALAAKLREVKS